MNWWILSTIVLGAWVIYDQVMWFRISRDLGMLPSQKRAASVPKGPPIAPFSPPRSKPQCSCSCEDCSPVHGS